MESKIYTISVDMDDPGDPTEANKFSQEKSIINSIPTMNPKAYFNYEWLELADFKNKTNSNGVKIYAPGSVGYELNSSMYLALDWLEIWKTSKEPIKAKYQPILGGSNSFYSSRDDDIINVNPAGSGHSNFFVVSDAIDVQIDPFNPDNKKKCLKMFFI